MFGRPGAVYIEMPGDFVNGVVDEASIQWAKMCPAPPRSQADPTAVQEAVALLRQATRPLIIVGKGASYARAENELKRFVDSTGIPFLPTPMAKGLLPDDHPLCMSAARTDALRQADVVLLIGARLNWILHFGAPPRFKADVKIIQVDVCAEEIGNNVPAAVMLAGDAAAIVAQLNRAAMPRLTPPNAWISQLRSKCASNAAVISKMSNDTVPMSYYNALSVVCDYIS